MPAGGRVHLAAAELSTETFCLTYAEWVADIDLDALLALHAADDGTATMTVVRPLLPFGVADVDERGRRSRLRREAA